jgi:hypothetical protein
MRYRLTAILGAAAIGAIGAVAADAGSNSQRVTIGLSGDGTAIEGRVNASDRGCEKNRRVKVKATERGFFSDIDETNRSGRYRVDGPGGPMPPATYFAQALKKGPGCPSVRSKKFEIQ